jgi:hypothetical protein
MSFLTLFCRLIGWPGSRHIGSCNAAKHTLLLLSLLLTAVQVPSAVCTTTTKVVNNLPQTVLPLSTSYTRPAMMCPCYYTTLLACCVAWGALCFFIDVSQHPTPNRWHAGVT